MFVLLCPIETGIHNSRSDLDKSGDVYALPLTERENWHSPNIGARGRGREGRGRDGRVMNFLK